LAYKKAQKCVFINSPTGNLETKKASDKGGITDYLSKLC